jgi:hypothetical protein
MILAWSPSQNYQMRKMKAFLKVLGWACNRQKDFFQPSKKILPSPGSTK